MVGQKYPCVSSAFPMCFGKKTPPNKTRTNGCHPILNLTSSDEPSDRELVDIKTRDTDQMEEAIGTSLSLTQPPPIHTQT